MNLPIDQPLRFHPWFRPAAWGGRALARFLGKNLPEGEIGESWEVSDHPTHASVLATGNLYGSTLRELMKRHRGELLGPAAAHHHRFPWLIKLLDAHDWLSVQVHPDAAVVKMLRPGEGAKTEAWLVLDAKPGSLIYAGLRTGVGPDELRHALRQGTVADCLHQFEPRPGDFLFLPAGTVHAVGGGVLFAEIQETSDVTFRLYDWGRPRPLHIEEALASIDWTKGPRDPLRAWEADTLVRCPHFDVDPLCCDTSVPIGGAGRLQALIVAAGQGRLDNGEFVMAGDAWILPASMAPMALHAETPLTALLCSLPLAA
jgi:mannose-6-phosphate isomerase